MAATNTMQIVGIMRNAYKGSGDPGTMGTAIRGIANFFGADIGNVNLGNAQEMTSALQNLSLSVAQQKLKGQGSVTDAERQIIAEALMSAATDPRAFERIASTLEGVAKRDLDLGARWNAYAKTTDRPDIDQFNNEWTQAWSEGSQENPNSPQRSKAWNTFMGREAPADAPVQPGATGSTPASVAGPKKTITGTTKSGVQYEVLPAGATSSKLENGSPVVRMPIGRTPSAPVSPPPTDFGPPPAGGPSYRSEADANASAVPQQVDAAPYFSDPIYQEADPALLPLARPAPQGRVPATQRQQTTSEYLVGLSRNSPRGKAYAKNADSVRAMIRELGRTKDFSKRRAILETLKRQGFITE
jgi:hypothetical protein